MQRVKIFYWRTQVNVPETPQDFTYTELAWIHDQSFIAQEGDGWTVVSNAVVSVIGDGNEVLMATTMTREVDDSVPDAL
ncbi:hypothetical protein HWD99_06070 [Microbacterium sp. C5A9]|uniref:hypothetical protein n=1 Tax=Microbacterium sp. C5A9 TaxID=2736663 RepID=UPI001F52891F|nr:hypothetical protein [Microbacterium sp. C5A9]MCI1018185.1 hypothetical protein [Microbacterium sp. C5A9]